MAKIEVDMSEIEYLMGSEHEVDLHLSKEARDKISEAVSKEVESQQVIELIDEKIKKCVENRVRDFVTRRGGYKSDEGTTWLVESLNDGIQQEVDLCLSKAVKDAVLAQINSVTDRVNKLLNFERAVNYMKTRIRYIVANELQSSVVQVTKSILDVQSRIDEQKFEQDIEDAKESKA